MQCMHIHSCSVPRDRRVSVPASISYSTECPTQEEKSSHRPHYRPLQRSMCSNAEPREPSEPWMVICGH